MKPLVRLAILGASGSLLQAAGVYGCFRAGWPEVNLLAGVLLLLIGTTVSLAGMERHILHLRRRDSWLLAALAGPLGPVLVSRLQPGDAVVVSEPAPPQRTVVDQVIGLLLTVLVSAGLLWGLWWWAEGWQTPMPEAEVVDMQHHERLAYQRLQLIAQAQERYREQDWDGDGEKTYARFHIHLWQSVDKAGHPVAVGLIPQQLAFALSKRFALDGYVYHSIHHFVPTKARPKPLEASYPSFAVLDPALKWAVAALPAMPRRTGLIGFIVDSSGKIWAARNSGRIDDWVEVRSAEHLAEIQAGLKYPEPQPMPRNH